MSGEFALTRQISVSSRALSATTLIFVAGLAWLVVVEAVRWLLTGYAPESPLSPLTLEVITFGGLAAALVGVWKEETWRLVATGAGLLTLPLAFSFNAALALFLIFAVVYAAIAATSAEPALVRVGWLAVSLIFPVVGSIALAVWTWQRSKETDQEGDRAPAAETRAAQSSHTKGAEQGKPDTQLPSEAAFSPDGTYYGEHGAPEATAHEMHPDFTPLAGNAPVVEPEPIPPVVISPERLQNAEAEIGKRVVGQDEAVGAVARALRRHGADINDPDRPLGSFLFLGPTGVGKTELARSLAVFLFDDPKAMVRLDMSEFFDRHTLARLLGSPPGYVGFGKGGKLTEPVRRRPQSVVLLDEIEKADSDVWNILLSILDEGRLTDSLEQTIDFTKTLIICTSNLSRQALEQQMPPELRNRFDEIIFFRPLSPDELKKVAEIQLAHVATRLKERRNVTVTLTPAAKELLVREGYDPQMGVRPLKRVIRRLVEDKLAEMLVAGQLGDGDTVIGDVAGSELRFEVGRGS